MNNQLQNEEFILPGNLGYINMHPITALLITDGAVTMTISPNTNKLAIEAFEDIPHEEIAPTIKQLPQ